MQALKIQGAIDESGHLIVSEPINLTPGEVEVIILQPVTEREETRKEISEPTPEATDTQPEKPFKTQIKEFKDLFANTTPAPADFDPDRAKWEYLKEKHNL